MKKKQRCKLPLVATAVVLTLSLACTAGATYTAQDLLIADLGNSYSYVSNFSDGYAQVMKGDHWSHIDAAGSLLNPLTTYDYAGGFSNGYAIVKVSDGTTDTWGVIDTDGNVVIPIIYEGVSSFKGGISTLYHTDANGSSAYRYANENWEILPTDGEFASYYGDDGVVRVKRDGVYCYVNAQGELLPGTYVIGSDFYNGLASVATAVPVNGCYEYYYGYIDTTGEIVIPQIYDSAGNFNKGAAQVTTMAGETYYIDTTGAKTTKTVDGYIEKAFGLSTTSQDGKYGLMDRLGNIITPCIYDKIDTFGDVGFKVTYTPAGSSTTYTGLLDSTGQVWLEPIYTTISSNGFNEDLLLVAVDGKYGYINESGGVVIPFLYESGGRFSEGLAWVKLDGMWGAIDTKGNVIIDFDSSYSDTGHFVDGIAVIDIGYSTVLIQNPLNLPQDTTTSSWATAEVTAAKSANLLTSQTQANFTTDITRGAFAELIVNMVELTLGQELTPSPTTTFTDTTDTAILKANAAGIVTGLGNGTFGASTTTNREQIATMIYRAMDYIANNGGSSIDQGSADLSAFTDVGQVSSWALDAVGALSANGIMQGTSTTTLSPQSTTTIEQSIILIYRLFQQV